MAVSTAILCLWRHEQGWHVWQKCISACPHYWQTNLGHKLPINNTNTGNSMYQKNFKTYSGYLLTYIYLLITVCAPLVLALNTIKMISKLLWLVIHGFHVTYKSVFFTTCLKMWITRMICFCFQLCMGAFSWYHKHLTLTVMKVSFLEKDLQFTIERHVTNIINVS